MLPTTTPLTGMAPDSSTAAGGAAYGKPSSASMEKHLRDYLAFTHYLPWVKSSGITHDPGNALTKTGDRAHEEGPFETIFAMELAQKLAAQDRSSLLKSLERAMGHHGYEWHQQHQQHPHSPLHEGAADVHLPSHSRHL